MNDLHSSSEFCCHISYLMSNIHSIFFSENDSFISQRNIVMVQAR